MIFYDIESSLQLTLNNINLNYFKNEDGRTNTAVDKSVIVTTNKNKFSMCYSFYLISKVSLTWEC